MPHFILDSMKLLGDSFRLSDVLLLPLESNFSFTSGKMYYTKGNFVFKNQLGSHRKPPMPLY